MSILKIKIDRQSVFCLLPGAMGLITAWMVSWLCDASAVTSFFVAAILTVNGVVVGMFLYKKSQSDLAKQAEIERERSEELYERLSEESKLVYG